MSVRVLLAMLLVVQAGYGQARLRSFLVPQESLPAAYETPAIMAETPQGEKSAALAVLMSLVLPGTGEWYAGNIASGRWALATDAGLWMSYTGFRFHASWLRDDARAFAEQHAGASLAGKDTDFEVNIGNFATVEEYNEQKLRNRQYDIVYTSSEYAWAWDSDDSRRRFKDLRIRSDEIRKNAEFFIAGLVINRVLSAFSAARSVSAHNREVRSGAWQWRATPQGGLPGAHGIEVHLVRTL